MLNAISVDVEEYFHAANLEKVVGPARWWRQSSRIEHSTDKLLNIFAEQGTKGTFFILGSSARRHPGLVRRIAQMGHEIGSHGYGHRLVYRQTERQFFRDVYRTKRLLEDITGEPVRGYRAPNFSITDAAPWAYDCLVRAGYSYDSSRYPILHPRYSNAHQPRKPTLTNTPSGPLVVLPLATTPLSLFGHSWHLPVAGGAYWRLLPRSYIRWGLQKIANRGEWFICYLHPWELDSEQPVYSELSPLTKLRHYGGCDRLSSTLRRFLAEFPFSTLYEAAQQEGELFRAHAAV